MSQMGQKPKSLPERSHVSFRQLLRTYQRTRIQQLCATPELTHRSKQHSLDHAIHNGKYTRRDCKAERLCSLHVDDQLELSWQHDREIAGFLTFEIRAT